MGTDQPSAFETKATYEQTQLEVYQEQFDKWVSAPLKILWDDYRGRVGIIIVAFYLLMGTVGTMVFPEPNPNQGPRLAPPVWSGRRGEYELSSTEFLLGTDGSGVGLLEMMVHATPPMLQMILAGAIFANLLGVSLGLFTGYIGGTTDKAIMTMSDTLSSIPGIPLLIIIVAILEPTNPFLIGIVLSIQSWAGMVRIIRSQVIPLANLEHVEASRAMGQPMSNLLVKDILPHLLPYIFIGFLGGATSIIFASVGLYFLGILPMTGNNWGITLNYAYNRGSLYSLDAAHWIIVPLVTITGLTVGLTMLAQAFDQVFNPRVRARHRGRKGDDGAADDGSDLDSIQTQMDTMQ